MFIIIIFYLLSIFPKIYVLYEKFKIFFLTLIMSSLYSYIRYSTLKPFL